MLAKTLLISQASSLEAAKLQFLFSPLEAFTDSHLKLPIFRAEVNMLNKNLVTLANFSFHTIIFYIMIIYNILYLQIKCRIHTFKQR